MRIALVPSAYVPLIGGVEELTRRLARQLVVSGDEVEVWTTSVNGAPAEDEVDGIRVRRFGMPMPPARLESLVRLPVGGGRSLAGLLRAARSFRPDVLHVQCFSVNGAYATILSLVTRVPLVITLQGETFMDDHDIYERAISLRGALRLGFRRAAAVTGCSQFVLDDAANRFGLREGNARVIYNGVEAFEGDPTSVPLPFRRFVLCLGRVVPKKGFDLAIKAFSSVADDLPEVGLVIAGGGPFQAQLAEYVTSLGMAHRVHFTGFLDRTQVEWVMRHADLFVMPSRVEPFGIVALEAWRTGCPLIVSSNGGAPEFVRDGVNGIVVDPTDTARLAGAMMSLLEDRSLRERLVAGGAGSVREFDWHTITTEYRRLYEQALETASSLPRARSFGHRKP